MTIYGNAPILELIRTMAANDRLPHAALLYGEKGRGRKTIARYFAMTALCTGDHAPCGECSACKKLLHDDMDEVHPHPEVALSDGDQSLTPKNFSATMEEVRKIAAIMGRK